VELKPEPKETKPETKPCGSNPYRGKYGILFESAIEWIAPDKLFAKVAAMTGQSRKQVRMAFNVLANENHSSNKGRSKKVQNDGMVRLVAK